MLHYEKAGSIILEQTTPMEAAQVQQCVHTFAEAIGTTTGTALKRKDG